MNRPRSVKQQQRMQRATKAGLYYVNEFDRGIKRRRCGTGFTYIHPNGKTVRSSEVRDRIAALVIPPAWEQVWICPRPDGHVQARGEDEAGRTQCIYHERWQCPGTGFVMRVK